MRKVLFGLIVVAFLVACGDQEASYTIVEEDINTEGGKSTVRLYTEDMSEDNIKAIIKELRMGEYFGSASIHAWIHEPPTDNLPDYGSLSAVAKYAHSTNGLAQVGVEETGKVYIEFQ